MVYKYISRRYVMSYKVDNAIIMAAGLASRFAPISYEKPKALVEVKGEILIERQIRQLKEAGIEEIILIVGYKKEMFQYLAEKFGVRIVENPEYNVRNNNSSIYAVRKYLRNSYICSADNYFPENPFESEVEEAYYSAIYAHGETKEWCMDYDEEGWITNVTVGGRDKWYMLGHAFWSEEFSHRFVDILNQVYDKPETVDKFWENIYIDNMDQLKLKIRRYQQEEIYEFDSLDELREFDESYIENTRSDIISFCANELGCKESQLIEFQPMKDETGEVVGCSFMYDKKIFTYDYQMKCVGEGSII